MTDAPEKIWINKSFGKHPEDWDFSIGMWETKKHLREKIEYTRSDVAQAMVAAALDKHENASGFHMKRDTDARAALDAMLAKAREDALRELEGVVRSCIYHDAAGSGFDQDAFESAIEALIDRTAEGDAQ